jgi:hypothetical protein
MRMRARFAGPLFTVALALGACTTLPRSDAQSTLKLVEAAGFEAEPVDTAEELAYVNRMPLHQVVSQDRDGHLVYVYADPDGCHCLYVGGPKEYSAYRRLSREKEIAAERNMAAMDWDDWDPSGDSWDWW